MKRVIRGRPDIAAEQAAEKTRMARSLIDEIGSLQDEAERIKVHLQDLLSQLLRLQLDLNQDVLCTATYQAAVVTPQGRSTTTIDPVQFLDKVGLPDFLAAASVSVTAARKLLGEKELLAISTVTPPEPKDKIVKVTTRKTK